MSKEAIVQIRMDSQMKESVEALYRSLGTSFPEAVRVFASQSIKEKGYPFVPKAYSEIKKTCRGILSEYASDDLRSQEKDAYLKAMVKKHG